ncbi:MAG: hypothetical protein JSR58_03415 [Verrucomicrobia bacterium]|nr:hypothetical protein [Verrucomicrobiota bacterium]
MILFERAIHAFNERKLPSDLSIHRLKDPQKFHSFSYLKEKIQTSNSNIQYFSDFIRMGHSEDGKTGQYFADFAAVHLGGGCFGVGFVQEERLVTACPSLANYIARQSTAELIIKNNQPPPPSCSQCMVCPKHPQ